MELKGKIEGKEFIINENEERALIYNETDFVLEGLTENIFHPIEGHSRRVRLEEGILEAFLVLNEIINKTEFNIELTEIPDFNLETENEIDGETVLY